MMYWDKNLQALRKKEEALYEKVVNKDNTNQDKKYELFMNQAKDGSDILGIIKDGKSVSLNSTYRPDEEAVKFAGKIQLTENSITVLVGMGNGRIASEILNKLNKEALLLIYEPSFQIFQFVMEHFDLTELIADKRVLFFIESINESSFASDLSYCLTSVNVGVTVLEVHPKYRELFPERYQWCKNVFEDCREMELVNLQTKILRNRLMVQNAISTIPYFLHSKLSTDLIGKFPKDMPAIIVAGGPSLDKNYEVLRQAKGKALIIAVDRVAKFLLDRGIEPDLFCSLDYSKNLALFEDDRLKNIPLLYIPDVRNQVLEVLQSNKLIYAAGNHRLYDWLIQQQGKSPMDLPYGGSVATLAFSFVACMGFQRTILVGQDLALSGGVTYAGGWQSGRIQEEEYNRKMVPGNVEEWVETRGDLYVYLQWFKQAVSEVDMEVVNATEGGARIDGTKVMTLQEAVDSYCNKEYEVAAIFDKEEMIFPQDNLKEVYSLLSEKLNEIKKIKNKAKDAKEYARRCKVLAERNDYGKEFKEKNRSLSRIGEFFENDIAASLVNAYVESELLELDMDLYVTEDDNQQEMLRLYQKLEYDYNIVYEKIDELIESYSTMLLQLRKELEIDE